MQRRKWMQCDMCVCACVSECVNDYDESRVSSDADINPKKEEEHKMEGFV